MNRFQSGETLVMALVPSGKTGWFDEANPKNILRMDTSSNSAEDVLALALRDVWIRTLQALFRISVKDLTRSMKRWWSRTTPDALAPLCRPQSYLNCKPKLQFQARHLHIVNMLIALDHPRPSRLFRVRYYKKPSPKSSSSRISGGTRSTSSPPHRAALHGRKFLSMHLRREGKLRNPLDGCHHLHIYFGNTLVSVFVIHLIFGPFRFWDRDLREMQIWLHWGFGWAEYILAAFTFFSAAGIPQGLMNCESFGIYVAFLLFQVIFYAIMENQFRSVTKPWICKPPRRYYPIHTMRIFIRMPSSVFRGGDAHLYFSSASRSTLPSTSSPFSTRTLASRSRRKWAPSPLINL
ncbi:hypothetical protein Ocin01_16477 [Orchesella cincta]|uniref:Uncharacterized protein n=1 Tax=Orchesella cincta TaxID=48709 RepID=A0A1D2MBA7_ORCCI|nr:hypothetical protein Ocin01_16477 [Orchesella cincta]